MKHSLFHRSLALAAMVCASSMTFCGIAYAQETAPVAPPAAAQEVNAAEYDQAVQVLRIMNAGFSDPKINGVTKSKLFTCLFANPLRTINSDVQSLFKQNPSLKPSDDTHLFRIVTAACGVTQEEFARPATPAPAPSTPQPETPGN